MAFVRHVAALDAPQKDGATLRAYLVEAARRGSVMARAQLRAPEFPESLDYLWRWFVRLLGARTFSVNGPERFTPPFIESAARLYDWPIQPHEAEALADLDLAYLNARAEAAA